MINLSGKLLRGHSDLPGHVVTRFRGEMFGSVAIRAYRQGGRYKYGDGRDSFVPRYLHTIRNHVCSAIPENPIQELELIEEINDASYFPLLDLVLNNAIEKRLRDYSTFEYPGINLNPDTTARFCPVCALGQRRDFGVSWWMRDLNLPHVGVCPRHAIPLNFVPTEYALFRGGRLPHEMIVPGAPLPSPPSQKQVVKAAALALLCRESPRIDSNVFKAWVEQAHANLQRNGRSLNSIVIAEGSFNGSPPFFHDELVSQPEAQFWLTAFAAVIERPQETIEELIRKSNRQICPSPDIKEVTLEKIIHGRFNGARTLRGPSDVVKKIVRNIEAGLARARYQETAQCLAPLIVEFLLLEELSPKVAEHFLHLAQWEKNVGLQTLSQRQAAWHFINSMLEARESGDVWRSPAFKTLAASHPVIPAWQESYLGALLRYGENIFTIATKSTYRHYGYNKLSRQKLTRR